MGLEKKATLKVQIAYPFTPLKGLIHFKDLTSTINPRLAKSIINFFILSFQSKIATIQSYGLEKYIQNMRQLNGSTDYEFNTCNKMFLAKDISARECMTKLLKEELEIVDFKQDPATARNLINTWVEKTTKRHIKDLLSPDAVHENTKLILVSIPLFFIPEI